MCTHEHIINMNININQSILKSGKAKASKKESLLIFDSDHVKSDLSFGEQNVLIAQGTLEPR